MRWWIIVPVLALCGVLVWAVVIHRFAPTVRRIAQQRTELYFRTHFHSSVQISGFHVGSVFPQVQVSIDGVVLRQYGQTSAPPVLQMQHVRFNARTLSLFSHRPVIGAVWLDGLQVRVAPRPPGSAPLIRATDQNLASRYPVVVRNIYAKNAELIILPRDRTKKPHEFDLHQLVLGPVGFGHAATFRTNLTNPVPTGEIQSDGTFGPWDAENPGATPVSGHYTFQNADMGTLHGLQGTLSSTGTFDGPLNYLDVQGETETPDFSLRRTHHPVDLHTTFSAIVDGTNGNTILKDVIATFGHSTLDVKGEVVDRTPGKGRTIVMDATTRGATVQDLLRLAIDADRPMMTGAALLHAKIHIGEGKADLINRMKLSGQFQIGGARFTTPETAEKIESLSLKAQGHPTDPPLGDPVSDFSGDLQMGKGMVALSRLTFDVAGAAVALDGTYNLDSGDLDLRGKLRMKAKLSQTTTGPKSFFLKAIDPFFEKKGAGTVLPIKITGTRNSPTFGLDFHDSANHE